MPPCAPAAGLEAERVLKGFFFSRKSWALISLKAEWNQFESPDFFSNKWVVLWPALHLTPFIFHQLCRKQINIPRLWVPVPGLPHRAWSIAILPCPRELQRSCLHSPGLCIINTLLKWVHPWQRHENVFTKENPTCVCCHRGKLQAKTRCHCFVIGQRGEAGSSLCMAGPWRPPQDKIPVPLLEEGKGQICFACHPGTDWGMMDLVWGLFRPKCGNYGCQGGRWGGTEAAPGTVGSPQGSLYHAAPP